eukprot:CAMPEP_0117608128 /NCGR_PEP_ID=MMETSP0784-20121206/80650_1 /TAXON_ID=39447 /ORGANISM="" /LENGTH=33 /DNA_ID= /DNA_START= /DNA_END= /DNA_ORIENTATION=
MAHRGFATALACIVCMALFRCFLRNAFALPSGA